MIDAKKKARKFNQTTGKFDIKGGKWDASEITAGSNGRAVIQEAYDRRLFVWMDATDTWEPTGEAGVYDVNYGKDNRLYMISNFYMFR